MRKHEQKKLIELINSVNEGIDYVFSNADNYEKIQAVLLDCYSGIVFVENFIKENSDSFQKYDISEIKNTLETFNEMIINGENCKKIFKSLKRSMISLENLLKSEKITIEAVFLPYKASMWDSLESIWAAADKDENCRAVVMPIPYFDINADQTLGQMHYEGGDYPDYVPVTNYAEYDLNIHMPDIIFIHNPYDDSNLTIRIHPMFYSDKLKQYTDMLVYVPYFVLYEEDDSFNDPDDIKTIENFIKQPALIYSDKVIVQSEKMKRIYIDTLIEYTEFNNKKYWNDKILGLGSPKYDRLLSYRKNSANIPDEWLKAIQKKDGTRKKIILYNTSIKSFLENHKIYFQKMKKVFKEFSNNKENIVLLWRPHPTLMQTINAMCPWLLDEYKNIVDEFKKEDGWIYDDTADVDRAMILSDAYYGDWSSLVALYQKTGKPVMIQQFEYNPEEF